MGPEGNRAGPVDPLGLDRLGYVAPTLTHRAVRHEAAAASEASETVVEEVPVALVYNGVPHVVMMATPEHLHDFAVGFSVTEGLVDGPADILGVDEVRYSKGIELQVTVRAELAERITARNRRISGRTGCGICGAESFDAVLRPVRHVTGQGRVAASAIVRAMDALRQHQALNDATGAVHAAAWAATDGTIVLVREDVGRHNALDKVIGGLLRLPTDLAGGFLIVTSRASFEMVQKAAVFGAPLLAAISGPTGLAVRLAHQSGLTLVGFVREGRQTVYTHSERVAGSST